ncbi:MAG: Restriction endonuclease [Pelotomaculum sp. PtaB.Bin104]|nr:MAG: Restriction endonuclease [Pelotomaculum sp. PtaB.Bin104]
MSHAIKEPKEDTRSFLGRQVDQTGSLLLVWLITFLLMANLIGKPATALIFSIPLIVAEALVFKKFLRIRRQKKQNQRRLWLAGQKIIKNFKSMDPESEFKPYVREIIAGLAGFQNLRLISKEDNAVDPDKWGIDLVGDYRGIPVAIQCKYPEGENKISPQDIRAFAGALKSEEFKNGLLVTWGEFEPGATRVAAELSRKGINIKLIGRYRLIEMARQSNQDVNPGGQTGLGADFLTAAGKQRTMSLTTLKDTILSSRSKAKSYFSYGLLLYGGYILMRETTKLSLLYLGFAMLNFLLGAGCLSLGRDVEDKDPLASFGSDK